MEADLWRSDDTKILGGVCAGLGERFEVDPVWFRLAFILVTLASGGLGLVVYIILWAVLPLRQNPYDMADYENRNYRVPEDDDEDFRTTPPPPPGSQDKTRGNLIGGIILIVLGLLFFAEKFIPDVNFADWWPLLLIIIGIYLLVQAVQRR